MCPLTDGTELTRLPLLRPPARIISSRSKPAPRPCEKRTNVSNRRFATGQEAVTDMKEVLQHQLPAGMAWAKKLVDLPLHLNPFQTVMTLWHVPKPVRPFICAKDQLLKEYLIMMGHAQIVQDQRRQLDRRSARALPRRRVLQGTVARRFNARRRRLHEQHRQEASPAAAAAPRPREDHACVCSSVRECRVAPQVVIDDDFLAHPRVLSHTLPVQANVPTRQCPFPVYEVIDAAKRAVKSKTFFEVE